MYNIFFCKITGKDETETAGISSLEYIKIMYEEIKQEELTSYSELIAENCKFIFDKIIDNQYGLFKNNKEFCLFYELIEE